MMTSEQDVPHSTLADSSERSGFFSNQKTALIIRDALTRVVEFRKINGPVLGESRRFVLSSLEEVLSAMVKSPSVFEEYCPFNIDYIGDKFIERLEVLGFSESEPADELLSMCYRFLLEWQVSTRDDLPPSLLRVVHLIHEHQISERAQSQVIYAEHQMMVGVFRRYMYHPDIVEVKKLPKLIAESVVERSALEEQLGSREGRIAALKSKLAEYETAFNFVGLYSGFKGLRDRKVLESRGALLWMVILGISMLSPFIARAYLMINPDGRIVFDVSLYFSVAGFELIMLFLFRVALHGYRSLQAQLIQLDLRMALCQFIQSYADYAVGIKKDNPQLLDRFDQLIFSGIVSSEGSLPSTFDGLDQIANVLEKLKGK